VQGLVQLLAVSALLGLSAVGEVVAQDAPPPYPEFTFKRVKPPAPGASKRITVQITPMPETVPDAVLPDVAPSADAGRYDWFWAAVSPALDQSGPGRLDDAIAALSGTTPDQRVAAPRLQDVQAVAAQYNIDLLQSSVGTSVSPAFALAVIMVESGGRADAISPAGATGLMQLMPATAERFDVSDAKDAADNIKGGVAYLDWLMDAFGRDPIMVLAAYNAGENAVRRHEGVPPFPETRDYVPKVLSAWTVTRALCLTPPELISDGCVFARPTGN
jgi:soluble lytic murein transglycosylase-like protein